MTMTSREAVDVDVMSVSLLGIEICFWMLKATRMKEMVRDRVYAVSEAKVLIFSASFCHFLNRYDIR